MNARQKLIQRKVSMPSYLAELTILAGRRVDEKEVSSLIEMVAFREKLKPLENSACEAFTIPFEEMKTLWFKEFVRGLYAVNSGSVLIWTGRSRDCGLFKLSSIADVHFEFPFEINAEGMIIVSDYGARENLLMDFSEDDSGNRFMKVKVNGHQWPSVAQKMKANLGRSSSRTSAHS